MKINKAKTGMLLFGAALSVMGIQAGAFSARRSPLSLSDTTKVDTAKQVADTYVSGKNTIDEVIWVVGDEPILLSEVEITKLQGEAEGMKWDGDPEYLVPEQIAVQKLFFIRQLWIVSVFPKARLLKV